MPPGQFESCSDCALTVLVIRDREYAVSRGAPVFHGQPRGPSRKVSLGQLVRTIARHVVVVERSVALAVGVSDAGCANI